MNQEATAIKLLAIRKQAEQTAQNIDQISRNLYAEREALRQTVSKYGAKRIELLKQEFHARGMTWCTYCSEVVSEGEAEFMLVEGREEYSHGYENFCYGFRGFLKLHRVCPACRERASDKHGQRGPYNSQMKDQTSFYAFRVEKRDDGYYAHKFGHWFKLDDENCKLDEPTSQLVELLAEEWNLPPRIEIKSEWPITDFEEKLVIHERAMTEAS